MQPKVLLLDKPFAALDVQIRARTWNILLDVWHLGGASALFVSHHIDAFVTVSDPILVPTARPGRIKTIAPVDLPHLRDPLWRQSEERRST